MGKPIQNTSTWSKIEKDFGDLCGGFDIGHYSPTDILSFFKERYEFESAAQFAKGFNSGSANAKKERCVPREEHVCRAECVSGTGGCVLNQPY